MYDFGDNWRHEIDVRAFHPPTTTFECIEGRGHGAAEDVGSVDGWNAMVKAYKAAKPSSEQREQMEWYGKKCVNGDPKGLESGGWERFDIGAVNALLKANPETSKI